MTAKNRLDRLEQITETQREATKRKAYFAFWADITDAELTEIISNDYNESLARRLEKMPEPPADIQAQIDDFLSLPKVERNAAMENALIQLAANQTHEQPQTWRELVKSQTQPPGWAEFIGK